MNALIGVSSAAPSVHKVATKHRYGQDPIFYPLHAIRYALSHRELFWIILKVACVGVTVAIIVLATLLVLALKPQAQAISANLEWWAWLIAVFLVIFEAGIVSILLMTVSQSKAQTDVFTATMKIEGAWKEGMVEQSIAKDLNPVKKAFIVRIVTLPLQIIPFVGGALYAAINATFIGWDHLDRYFEAIQLSPKLQRVEIFGKDSSDCRALCNLYTYDIDNDVARFGFFCGIVESAPVFGWILGPITNSIATALYACDIENSGGLLCLREEGKDYESHESIENANQTSQGPLDALRETGERVMKLGETVANTENDSRATKYLKEKARASIISSISRKT